MIYYGGNDYRDYIAHYGVVGMHWGIRRYQPYSYTSGRDYGKSGKEMGLAAKLGRGLKSAKEGIKEYRKAAKERSAVRKVKRAEAAKVKAEKKAEQKRIKEEKKKEDIINSGDIEKVMKNKSRLSMDELRRATDRIVAENRLRDLESEEAMKSIERGKRLIANVADMTRNVSSIYNTASDFKKKMDDAAAEKAKKIRDKEQDKILSTNDPQVVEKAIREGKLDSDHIKKFGEMQKSYMNVYLADKKKREFDADRDADIEAKGEALKTEYESRAIAAKERNDEKTSSVKEDYDQARERMKSGGYTQKDKITLTLNEGHGDYNPLDKHETRSNASKKGWDTKRAKQEQTERYRKEAEEKKKASEEKAIKATEAAESYRARQEEKNMTKQEKADKAVQSYKEERARKDNEASQTGYEYFKTEREKKNASELQRKAKSKEVEEAQTRGQSEVEKALEELRKKGYSW